MATHQRPHVPAERVRLLCIETFRQEPVRGMEYIRAVFQEEKATEYDVPFDPSELRLQRYVLEYLDFMPTVGEIYEFTPADITRHTQRAPALGPGRYLPTP
jgi:hypothetical protein